MFDHSDLSVFRKPASLASQLALLAAKINNQNVVRIQTFQHIMQMYESVHSADPHTSLITTEV